MTDLRDAKAQLRNLNENYVRSVEQSDVTWFDQHLSREFYCTTPDGALLDRAAFLEHTAKPAGVRDLRPHEVVIRIFGDHAIIHARTSYQRADGTRGNGRYTDDWAFEDGQWRCVSAHVSRFQA